jgi:hypothetical protein
VHQDRAEEDRRVVAVDAESAEQVGDGLIENGGEDPSGPGVRARDDDQGEQEQ